MAYFKIELKEYEYVCTVDALERSAETLRDTFETMNDDNPVRESVSRLIEHTERLIIRFRTEMS